LFDTGAVSIAGTEAIGNVSPSQITTLAEPIAIATVNGEVEVTSVWRGKLEFGGSIVLASLFLVYEYRGGIIVGDDLQDALEVTISTKKGIRLIEFTSLGVRARSMSLRDLLSGVV